MVVKKPIRNICSVVKNTFGMLFSFNKSTKWIPILPSNRSKKR